MNGNAARQHRPGPRGNAGRAGHSGSRAQPVSGTSRALSALVSRWPGRRIPQGGLSRVAREVNVSRQVVALAARSHGFRIDSSLAPLVERAATPPHPALQLLHERYPGKSLPRGALTEVAGDLGLKPSAVARVAQRAGFRAGTTAALEDLRARYPGLLLPRGEIGRLARQLGLSEKVVRKAANRAGFRVASTPRLGAPPGGRAAH